MGARPSHYAIVLSPREDLFKCPGRDLPICSTCSRILALDAGAGQRWINRLSTGDTCKDYADVQIYGRLYV